MSATEPSLSPIRLHKALTRIWGTPPGWRGRLSAVNHNILGMRFMITALVFFAIGGTLAMLIRIQLASPQSPFMGPEIYNQIFTMHGSVMMFLFAIPMLEGFAIYMLPKLLGSRDLAFPRLTAYGYWCYLFGGSMLIIAMLMGVAPNSGWFMYTPLSSSTYAPGINSDVWLLGVTFVEISAVTAAIELLVTILKMRAPGMTLGRMPIFGWYMLVTAGMMLIGFPPLILGSILLELERAFNLPFFDPTRGGDPLLWQHLFWLFGHPEVYIILLPATGALSTMIPTFARAPLMGYRAIVIAIVAIGFLSFGLWVHHMFTVGMPHLSLAFFSAASAMIAIPTAVQIFAWIGTLASGRPRFDVPMLYIVGFFVVFVAGGLTGVMLAMVPFNTQAHDSHFVVAHLHYVLFGGFVFPMLAALYYWLPHFSGRRTSYRLSVPAFWLIFIGFNLTFFLMHLTGLMGMPRRISAYPSNYGWDLLNLLSSVGSFVLSAGLALVLVDLVLQVRGGPWARRNPWEARTLEWATPTPPPAYNFAAQPLIDDRADELDVETAGRDAAAGRGYLGFAREQRMEVVGVDIRSGAPDQIIVLPGPTLLPLVTALATGVVFTSMLFKIYWLAGAAVLLTAGLFWLWSRALGSRSDRGPLSIGLGATAPEQDEARQNTVLLGTTFAIVFDATVLASLLFGAVYLLVVVPGEEAVAPITADLWLVAAAVVTSLAASLAAHLAAAEPANPRWRLLALASVLGLVSTVSAILLAFGLGPAQSHARAAVGLALTIYAGLHGALAMLIGMHAYLRGRTGFASPVRNTDLRLARRWTQTGSAVTLACLGMLLVLATA